MTTPSTGAPAGAFAALGLPAPLVAAVADQGFTTPTDIQAASIPALLEGRDVTGVARTGTGKTAAFGLPLLASLDPGLAAVQALVLAPTRELAMQVAAGIEALATHMPRVSVLPVYGGAPFWQQQRALAAGAQVVVGTPGRLMDHLKRETLRLDDLRFVVLDEADEMLRMGFVDDVDTILSGAPVNRQTALFSATMPAPIRRVAQRHMRDPLDVTVAGDTTTAAGVTHAFAVVPFRERAEALARTLLAAGADGAIVFVRTKAACDDVAATLARHGIRAAVLNGDVAQTDRERIVRRLRDGGVDVLVATDVAARGLDVDRIELVVNFDAPQDTETYVHRVGRTGRAERTGRAITFLSPRERHLVRQIEKATGAHLVESPPPSPADVFTHRARHALTGVAPRLALPRVDDYRAAVAAYAAEHGVDMADVAAALLAQAAGDDGSWTPPPPPAPHASRPVRERVPAAPRRSEPRRPRRGGATGTPYRIAVGHRHGARPANIVAALTAAGKVDGSAIGRIDIRDTHSLVEIMGDLDAPTRRRMALARIVGRPTRMERDRTH